MKPFVAGIVVGVLAALATSAVLVLAEDHVWQRAVLRLVR